MGLGKNTWLARADSKKAVIFRGKLHEDAVFICGYTPEQKQKKFQELNLQVVAQNPSYLGVPVESIAGQGLSVPGGMVTIATDQLQGFTINSEFHHDDTFSMNSITFTGR